MTFSQWLAANNYDEPKLEATTKKHLEAAWKLETSPPRDNELPFDKKMELLEQENDRQAKIQEIALKAVESNVGNAEKCKQLRALADAACKDQTVTVDKFRYEMKCADRMIGPMILTPSKQQIDDKIIEAAVCRAGGLSSPDKHFEPQVLEAADKHFPGGLGLQDLVGHFARKNGWRGASLKSAFNSPTILRAAFQDSGSGQDFMAGIAGPSTYSLPNILANIANKFLRIGFLSVDQAWQMIAATRPVNDLKQITTAALTGSLIYKQLPPGGEIEHGDIGEKAYTNQAYTQARMLGIDRADLINDDLGALTTASQRLGRGAALRINQMFWTTFLNNSAFFTSGNNNVVSSGASSVLSLTSLADADRIFRLQTDPDGQPLGVFPAILLVPSALRITALNLMNSTIVVATNTGTAVTLSPNSNVLAGAYQVVSSPYMSNAAFTGNSTTAWYLLASPAEMPVIEVAALNGRYEPTVDTTEADFNTLGIAMRGYIDIGVALQEFRGGVRSPGA